MDQEKYDRQIRLWGVDGQKEIENALIISLGSDAIASEFLKNLVLHAIGQIILVDDHVVNENDIGINFFLEEESIGKIRAEEVARLLHEMNPDPNISAINKPFDDLSVLDEIEEIKDKNTFVVTQGNLSTTFLTKLSEKVREKGMKQLHLQTTGFFGAFYLDAQYHYSFDGVETPNDDLRINKPFPALEEFFNSFDIDKISDEEHTQLPYPVLLYHARKRIFQKHPELHELNFQHLPLLLEQLKLMERSIEQENDSEAKTFAAANGLDLRKMPNAVEALFSTEEKYPQDDIFWKLVRASKQFYQEHGVIPHYGGCPDIESSSILFNKLKSLYQQKYEEDCQELAKLVPEADISFVRKFVKNIRKLTACAYPPLSVSLEKKALLINGDYNSTKRGNLITQNMFIVARKFKTEKGRDPIANDFDEFLDDMKSFNLDVDEHTLEDFVHEFLRFNGTVLPSVAASIASIAAQEITKVIIMQATPCGPIVVYDAIHGQILDLKL